MTLARHLAALDPAPPAHYAQLMENDLALATEAALAAGKLLRAHFGKSLVVDEALHHDIKLARGNGSWRRSPVAPHPHENGAAHSSFAGQSLNFINQRIDFLAIVCLVEA